ncbi:PepSY domain-containing protein [Metabacillus rhizolycopersici]|uniref:PepSY domain-containing protein n=1 Tax=Metabacillus rhizolycopersici TaxID=2875709 RepID=A0ABS7UZ39_9BACI|nr:PepSY domain-containing protein [Metabacillus rhizolycopersici]MBZ5753174.1 PepSY domain-containing protein [Metabacillus rhizolycopersici]
MKNRKWMLSAGMVLVLGLLLFVGYQWWAPSLSAQTLTEEEANKAALAKYPGDIIKTTKTKDEYQIDMQLETGVYHIRINAENGEVISIKRETESKEGTSEKTPDEKTTETPPKQLTPKEIEALIASQGDLQSLEFVEENGKAYYQAVVSKKNEKITLKLDQFTGEITSKTKEAASIITESEAMAIAEAHVKGEADDVEFVQPPEQTPYYLIEAELADGEDVIVQVDAYTKAVKSVTREEDTEDDED